MFSFSTVSIFATLALSALSSALPIDLPVVGDVANVPVVGGVVDTATGTVAGLTGSLPVVGGILRRDVVGVVAIITEAQSKIAPATDALSRSPFVRLSFTYS